MISRERNTMLLLLRFLPLVVGVTNVFLFVLQSRAPGAYPWIVLPAPFLVTGGALLIGWKRHQGTVLVQRSIPSLLAVAAAGYAMLLAEGPFAGIILPVIAGVASALCLELLFLMTYLPSRYPVNGLSHVNLSLVPITIWLCAFTSVGLTVFLNATRLLPVVTMAAAGALLFWSTSHVEASADEQRRWTLLGAWVGSHAGLLGAILPVGLTLQGALAALLLSLALRTRRYPIPPLVPRKVVLIENIAAAILLAVLLGTAVWV